MEKKINIGKKAKVEITWKVNPLEYSDEKLENIRTLFAKKYNIPISNVHVEKEFVTNGKSSVALNYENIKNITDPAFQHELFKQYLAESDIKDYNFEELLKIDSLVNNQMDYSQYEKGKKYSIKWLDWSNFLSYGGENHFDFTQLNGIVLLNGKPANKCGKSTFAYDLLHFLFFGETKSGKAKSENGQFVLGALFNSFLPDETELKVEGCITIDGVDYVIKRTLKRPAKSKKELRTATQKVEYYMINAVGEMEELPDVINLQQESSTKTSQIIKETIGNERDFDLIISATQKDLDDLISLKNDERGKLLTRWIGLSCLEDKNNIAKEMWNKKISANRLCDKYNRQTVSQEIVDLNNLLEEKEENQKKSFKELEECKKKLIDYTSDKERYISDKKTIDSSIETYGDLTSLEKKLETITNNGKNDSINKKNIENEIKTIVDYEYSDDEYKSLVKEKESLIEKISTIKANIQAYKEKNELLKNSEVCPTCHRKFDDIDNTPFIEENEKLIKKLINEGIEIKDKKIAVNSKIEDIDIKKENYKKKNNLELKLAAIETKLTNGRLEYKEVKEKIKKINENKEAIEYNNNLEIKINAINERIKVEESIKNRLIGDISSLQEKMTQIKEEITEKKEIISKIEVEEEIEKNWKLYLKLIGKEGISKIVLRNTLPIINGEINKLLDGATDFKVEVTMNEKNDVNFYMVRDNVKYNLAGASGLERTQSALALRTVLGNMSNLCKPDFLLLDEVLYCVDEEFYDEFSLHTKMYKDK